MNDDDELLIHRLKSLLPGSALSRGNLASDAAKRLRELLGERHARELLQPTDTTDWKARAERAEAALKGTTQFWDAWFAANDLPDDLKRKLSLHDLKRLGNRALRCFTLPEDGL